MLLCSSLLPLISALVAYMHFLKTMTQNQLTKTEIKYLGLFDRRDIRIRIERTAKNQGKWPLIENWTKYYSEPWTIEQMLNQGYNYGIRTGKKIGGYYNVVIDLDDFWAQIRINDVRCVETTKGIHRYLLIKELPKSCWLVNRESNKIGEIHSLGRQIVGIGSIHESGKRYILRGKANLNWSLKIENLKELQEFLKQRNIFTTPWGKTGIENIRDLELFHQKPKKTYQEKKAKLEKEVKNSKKSLHICYICLVVLKKDPQIIKEHLQSEKHLAELKSY